MQTSNLDQKQAWELINQADLLHGATEIELTLDRMGEQITDAMADAYPIVLCVMCGAVVFAGKLLPRLEFPLEFDYLHVTRYRDGTQGGAIEWSVMPHKNLQGRNVLLLDDILDEGHTLAATKARLLELGAADVKIAVLADKHIDRAKPIAADFIGMHLPNRYVFGMGMDAYGLWRNLPAIYALKD